jgi:hypothetical protein
MDLRDVATAFDNEVFQDYFNQSVTFYGQVATFADSTRSGPATPRRIISVAPDVVIPAKKVIRMINSGRIYIIGILNEDYWFDGVIRKKYPMIPVETQGLIGSVGTHLAGTGYSTDVFLFMTYVRRVPLEEESSLFFAGHEVHFPACETVSTGDIIKFDDNYFLVKVAGAVDGAGFGMCEAVQLESPMTTVTYTKKTSPYDPVTDTYVSTVISGVTAFIEPTRFNFLFTYPSFEKIEPGDKSISILKSKVAAVRVGDLVDNRTVLGVRDLGTYWTLHCR